MGIKRYKPYTPSRRHMSVSTFEEITKKAPEKSDANIFIYTYSLYIHHNQNPSIFS